MNSIFIVAIGLLAYVDALLRFGCAKSSIQRLDPLVNPGQNPSPHLHQIIGGNSFNISMDPAIHNLVTQSTCTSCQFTEDLVSVTGSRRYLLTAMQYVSSLVIPELTDLRPYVIVPTVALVFRSCK